MNKTKIKNFAIGAREKLIADITYKAGLLGITDSGIAQELSQSTADLKFFDIGTKEYAEVKGKEIKQREALVKAIREKEDDCGKYKDAFEFVVEEVAYTWFNRMIAIRFMEVNDYLPSGIRVLSSENKAKLEPDFVTTPFETDLEFTQAEQDYIIELKDKNKLDELFRMLFIKQCNKLNEILPELFEKTDDYTELLLTISFTDKDGIVYKLTHDVDEDDFNVEKEGQIEIIGWMYQFYNSVPKDTVFANLKKNKKIRKEDIPAATQLFTPDWIVRYMVENSLGRLYIDKRKNEGVFGDGRGRDEVPWTEMEQQRIKNEQYIADEIGWKYYVPEAEQTIEVRDELDLIQLSKIQQSVDEIKVIDPCMGSGHILVYAFDVLMQIYDTMGYTARDAVHSIIENNIYGLDIDKRAAQLAYFALMMKARQYDRRFLGRNLQPNVYAIRESNGLDKYAIDYFCNGDSKLINAINSIITEMQDAKEYGSIIEVTPVDFEALYARFDEIKADINMSREVVLNELLPLVQVAEAMAQKYDVVCTNPPYMGGSGMDAKLSEYVKKNYPDSKSDMFAVFIEKCGKMTKENGYQAMITQHAWMFLSSYEKLRGKLMAQDIVNMAHLGARAFDEIGGEVVQTTSFVMQKNHFKNRKGTYCRLIEPTSQQGKEDMFLAGENLYKSDQSNFSKIPGSPIAYWVSENFLKDFEIGQNLGDIIPVKKGMDTGDNEYFLRYWFEVNRKKIDLFKGNEKWIPYDKGGNYRKWFGNNEYVLNWNIDGSELKNSKANLRSKQLYFKKSITWNALSSYNTCFRYSIYKGSFDSAGSSMFPNEKDMEYYLGIMNCKQTQYFLNIINPTLNYGAGSISQVPIIISDNYKLDIEKIVNANVLLSKLDWDSFETSWDFARHPLLSVRDDLAFGQFAEERRKNVSSRISECYKECKSQFEKRFLQLKSNEEELNRIFIDIYGLQEELTPEVEDRDVTVYRIFDSKEEIPESMGSSKYSLTKQDVVKDLISYAVGCMFGRYSLDVDGLAYAGGDFSSQWTEVSGQCYRNEVLSNYECSELSRFASVAKGDGLSSGNIQSCENAPDGGEILFRRSASQSRCINSQQYCRGTGSELKPRICPFSVYSNGLQGRSTDTVADMREAGVSNEKTDKTSSFVNGGSGENAVCSAKGTVNCPLITDHFGADADNCIPITDEEYFEDDIVGRFVKFIEVVYGKDTLEENLNFIADALGNKGKTSREVIRNYFLTDFIKDHIKKYQKRPIYWLFDSGKQNGFKALVYMHRWNEDTVGHLRVEYLHKIQRVYEKEIERMQEIIDNSKDNKEISAANKRKEKLQKQLKETKDYDAKIAHIALSRIDIDLDDGVKVNYDKVQTVDGKNMQILAKI